MRYQIQWSAVLHAYDGLWPEFLLTDMWKVEHDFIEAVPLFPRRHLLEVLDLVQASCINREEDCRAEVSELFDDARCIGILPSTFFLGVVRCGDDLVLAEQFNMSCCQCKREGEVA